LTLAGCSGGENSDGNAKSGKQISTDGNAQGVLTINGKDYPLKYIYTARERVDAGEEEAPLRILITNEPLSQETLKRISLEFGVSSLHRRPEGVIKSASLKGAYFVVRNRPRYGEEKISYNGYVLTSDGFFDADGDAAIHFNDNKVSAKIENESEDSTISKKLERVEVKAKISVSSDAEIKDGTLLARSLSDSPPPDGLPDEGKASGTLTIADGTIGLTSAYALREKVEAGSGERITVLITDDPLPKESLLYSFERAIPGGYYGLYLYFDTSGNFRTFTVKHPYGFMGDITAAFNGLKLENGKIAGTAQYKSEDGDTSYSVTFDAPLKD
jgi:hypothetical protein